MTSVCGCLQIASAFNPFVDGKGELVAVGLSKDGGKRMILRGKEGPAFDDIVAVSLDPQKRICWHPVPSPDFKRFAYRGVRDHKAFMVIDEVVGLPFTGLEGPVFSPDGSHAAYLGRKDGRYRVVCGSRQSGLYSVAQLPVFSEDSRSLSYGARVDGEFHWVTWRLK